ncbi:MAG TPA: nitrous oxide-stimulated promoter family protein [Candidatus Sulfotelmatobacter sp.]|nr:nitrous oxide-stimulated promoter family protein [Candidatus Sulfotelmatobacter sp.]
MAFETTAPARSAPETRTAQAAADRPRPKRLAREWQTIAAMVQCYCRDHHQAGAGLCPECQGLLDYATLRLDRCRFGAEKPTCAKCPVHCYQRDRREQVKTIMRYAGPRMLWQHPILSLRHWLDGFKPDAESVAQVRCAGAERPAPGAGR